MRISSIKAHLGTYSIFQKRKTTINHAFASALAPGDVYDPEVLRAAVEALEQDPDGELICVYCGNAAQTWDHLVSLVKNSQLHGYGHQIGNLVPCCRDCNSKKGNRDWTTYVQGLVLMPATKAELITKLALYQQRFATEIDLARVATSYPNEWARYNEIREEIFSLMKEADSLASILRHP